MASSVSVDGCGKALTGSESCQLVFHVKAQKSIHFLTTMHLRIAKISVFNWSSHGKTMTFYGLARRNNSTRQVGECT